MVESARVDYHYLAETAYNDRAQSEVPFENVVIGLITEDPTLKILKRNSQVYRPDRVGSVIYTSITVINTSDNHGDFDIYNKNWTIINTSKYTVT